MKLLSFTFVVVLVGVVSTADLLDVTENDVLHRYKRAWRNEKKKVANCKAGEMAVVECVKCPVGYHTQEAGLWKACVKCPKGKTSLADKPSKCVPECPAGKTWNTNNRRKTCNTVKACCKNCPPDTFKEDAGSHECTPCPRFWKPNTKMTACNKLVCPAGYEEITQPGGTKTCAPCKFGHYKGKLMKTCKRCPDDRWTLTTGATALKECIEPISDPGCNEAFPVLAEALEQYAYNMTAEDTLGDILCYESTKVCEIGLATIACFDVFDESTGKQLPVYQDYEKSVNLTSIVTHKPWCMHVYEAASSSSSSYSSSSSSSGWWSSSSGAGPILLRSGTIREIMETLDAREPGDETKHWVFTESGALIPRTSSGFSSGSNGYWSSSGSPIETYRNKRLRCLQYEYAMMPSHDFASMARSGVRSGSGDPSDPHPDICGLRENILACKENAVGKELLPIYQDLDRSVNLSTIITHPPWCVNIYYPEVYSSSSSAWSSSSSAWSSSGTGVWGWGNLFDYGSSTGTTAGPAMFREPSGAGLEMDKLRMLDPGTKDAWWMGEGADGVAGTEVAMPESPTGTTGSEGSSSGGYHNQIRPRCYQYHFSKAGFFRNPPIARSMSGSGSGEMLDP